MQVELAIVVGLMYAAGFYLVMRRNIIKLIIGLSLLGHGANLLIFTAGGLTRHRPPLVPGDAVRLVEPTADPLPQAFVLTAIVIGFGITAFALVLFQRTYQSLGTHDVDEMRNTES
ncbi:MAG: Na+/H+ antiporter subunit C [Planctomycetota bacterium]|jgi:multicomponent Na+:H+ antiporter subunit C